MPGDSRRVGGGIGYHRVAAFASNDPDIAMVVTRPCPAKWDLDWLVAAIARIRELPNGNIQITYERLSGV